MSEPRAGLALGATLVAAMALLVGVLASDEEHQRVASREVSSTTTTTVPVAIRGTGAIPVSGEDLERVDLALFGGGDPQRSDDDEVVLVTLDGAELGRGPLDGWYTDRPELGVDFNDHVTGGGIVLVGASGIDEPVPGCAAVHGAGGLRAAVCGRDTDEIRLIATDGGTRLLSGPVAEVGHWRFAAPSPDGRWVLAQWSAECEVPVAYVIRVRNGLRRPVVTDGAFSNAIGWTPGGRAIVGLPAEPCGAEIDSPGTPVRARNPPPFGCTTCEDVAMAVETRYARNGDVHLAYQVRGSGGIDLLMPSFGTISIAAFDAERHMARFMVRLGSFARLLCYDLRGVGLSDPIVPSSPPTLETYADDALAVLDKIGCEKAFVFAYHLGGPAAILFAATHPDRVSGLVLCNTYARLERADDYLFGIPRRLLEQFSRDMIDPDAGSDTAELMTAYAPSVATDAGFQQWWEQEGLRGASPATARALTQLQFFADVRNVLPTVRVPTLVLHSRDALWCRLGHGRYMAEHIPEAKLVELPSADAPFFTDAADIVLGEVEEFLTGHRRTLESDRILTSIVFTDIAASTEHAAALGDQSWRELLDRHDELVRRQIVRFGGREIKTMGDGFLATFDGPARAVRCAAAIRDGARQLGMEIRAGVHTGEVEVRGDDIGGIAVNLAQRVSSVAGGGEVVVSATVKDLVFGSGIEFAERGAHELKGLPGTWPLYEVLTT